MFPLYVSRYTKPHGALLANDAINVSVFSDVYLPPQTMWFLDYILLLYASLITRSIYIYIYI